MARSFVATVVLLAVGVDAGMLMLNNNNWKKEVTSSPHGVFVNFCRQG